MGEYMELILEGAICQVCGDAIDDGEEEAPGHPVTCELCE